MDRSRLLLLTMVLYLIPSFDSIEIECIIVVKKFYYLMGDLVECDVTMISITEPGVQFDLVDGKKRLPYVQVLDLDNPNLIFLPVNLALNFPNLLAYEASKASLEAIERENFQGLTKLKILNLYRNNIRYLKPGTFSDLVNLEYLSIAFNKLQFIGGAILSDMPKLRNLFLENNELEFISRDAFKGSGNINMLVLRNNRISKLEPGVFDSLINLRTLSVSNNNLTEINSGLFKNNQMLVTFWLNGNNVSTIDADTFDHLEKLKIIQLKDSECTKKSKNLGVFNRTEFIKMLPYCENKKDVEIRSLKQQIKDLGDELLQSKKQTEILRTTNEQKSKQINKLQSEIKDLKLEKVKCDETIDNFKTEITEGDSKIFTLNLSVRNQNKTIEEQKNLSNNLKDELSKAKNETEFLIATNLQKFNQYNNLQNEIKDASKTIDNFSKEITECNNNILNLNLFIRNQNKTIEEQQNLNNDYLQTISDIKSSWKANQTANDDIIKNLKSLVMAYVDEKETWKTQLNVCNAQCQCSGTTDNSTAQLDTLQKIIEGLTNETSKLTDNIRNKEKELKTCQDGEIILTAHFQANITALGIDHQRATQDLRLNHEQCLAQKTDIESDFETYRNSTERITDTLKALVNETIQNQMDLVGEEGIYDDINEPEPSSQLEICEKGKLKLFIELAQITFTFIDYLKQWNQTLLNVDGENVVAFIDRKTKQPEGNNKGDVCHDARKECQFLKDIHQNELTECNNKIIKLELSVENKERELMYERTNFGKCEDNLKVTKTNSSECSNQLENAKIQLQNSNAKITFASGNDKLEACERKRTYCEKNFIVNCNYDELFEILETFGLELDNKDDILKQLNIFRDDALSDDS